MSKSYQASRVQQLTSTLNLDETDANIKKIQGSKGFALHELISSAQGKLDNANSIIAKTEALAEPWKVSKKIVADLLAPLRDIVTIVDAFADAHPALKVISGVVKVVVQMELTRHENDKQIAVVYFTMSSMLFLLTELDPLFDEEEHLHSALQSRMESVCETINGFGNFCDVYYRTKTFIKTLKSGSYKDKLSGYVADFSDHKKELHLLLSSQSSIKVHEIQTDVRKIVALLECKSAKEQKADEVIDSMGGLDAVCRDDHHLDELAKCLGEKIDASIRRSARGDLEDALRANFNTFTLKMDHVSQQIQNSVESSTQTILTKLDAGPHEYIEDPDIQAVWKEMNSRTSAKTRIFLDAVHNYFSRKFVQHHIQTGEAHPDIWTLHFLSKLIFYPAIGEAIDEDSSGFVSVHEVNNFIKSKPGDLSCSVVAWFAFWAAGPYKTDVEHRTKISSMLSDLEDLASKVLEANQKRVKYFCAIKKRLNLIDVYGDILGYLGEAESDNGPYESLEQLRVVWRNQELRRIRTNLEKIQFRLQGAESVSVVLDGRRIEQSIMALIYLLLHHHMKIVKLATSQPVAVAEFTDMRETWEYVFSAFDKRLDTLVEIWRQQRLEVSTQVDCYSAGLFGDWHEHNKAIQEMNDSSDDSDDSDEDSDYDYSADDEDGAKNEAAEGDDGAKETGEDDDGEPDLDDGATDASKRELASVMSAADAARKKETPETLLLYSVPSEPEDENGLTTDDESDWEPPAVRKRKMDAAVVKRLDEVETRLSTIEDMLRQVLAAVGGKPLEPTAEKSDPATETGSENDESDNEDSD